MNFRTVQHRFGHIDAEFVSAKSVFSDEGNEAEFVVRFYPWWEHPLYLAARDKGLAWGFSNFEQGKREVKVKAIAPLIVHISPRIDVTDLEFSEDHPLLWSFAERASLFVNGPVDRQTLIRSVLRRLNGASESDILASIELPETSQAPFGMSVPAPLYGPTMDALRELAVPVMIPRSPNPANPVVVLLLDDCDYIVARDFELDVPEFVHLAEWFNSTTTGVSPPT